MTYYTANERETEALGRRLAASLPPGGVVIALYGELGAVLDLPREDVPAYIRKTWPKWPLF